MEGPIIRVFRAITHPGREQAFERFFLGEAVPLLQRQEGIVDVQVGLPAGSQGREYLMITRWRSLDALKGFAGDNWDQAVIDPRERDLLAETVVYHYRDAVVAKASAA